MEIKKQANLSALKILRTILSNIKNIKNVVIKQYYNSPMQLNGY